MKNCINRTFGLIAAACVAAAVTPAFSQTVVIKLGTMVPEGSAWHEIVQAMGQEWKKISNGQVTLKIYPGGVLGDEVDMLRKVRIGQLQAVALSGVGLAHIDDAGACLQIPMLIDSYEELDYVRGKIAPKLEEIFKEKGYVVLQWSDAGWVHFFTKEPARTLDDIRKMKLWTSTGDADAERLYKEFGMQPIPLPMTDMLMSLETGLIDAYDIPPLFALLNQSFALAKNMIDVKWAPLVAATVIRRRTWERIPEELRPRLLEAARRAGDRSRDEIRKLGDDAIVEMEKRGLKVFHADAATLANWRAEAEAAYPKIRGTIVPEELFDEVVRHRNSFRIPPLLAKARNAKDPEQQATIYREILQLDPNHKAATSGLITSLLATASGSDDPEQQVNIYQEILQLDPDHKDAARALEMAEQEVKRL